MRLTEALMKGQNLPLEVALPRASRMLAEAKKQTSDFDQVVAALQKNEGLPRAEAILKGWSLQQTAKKGFQDLETNLDAAEQIVNQIATYSARVHQAETLPGRAVQAAVGAVNRMLDRDRDIAGLQRQRAYLSQVLRSLGGEKGVISDADIERAEPLLNLSLFAPKSISDDTARELRELVAKGRANLQKRKDAAATLGGGSAPAVPTAASTPAASPDNPLGFVRPPKGP
jgi:hypothetical protein